MNNEDKRLHLTFIENTIQRMSSNSFIIKGWSLTALGGLFTLYIANQNKSWSYDLLWLTLGCALMFWLHDAYYLRLEREYRKLYEEVAQIDAEKTDYSMHIHKKENMACTMGSDILLFSYGLVVVTILILLYVLKP
ncbi:hypothetical protein ACFQ4L_06845 [Lapidilactobacillus mulanensis]|uniref:DUF3899 domain-containing protein n=1 Tax=Lapidilactobacillus mulanensis TaxID=2485999 RepID=A0ABW4DRJ2_9LACO|nr:hypothetical protein [Lapidilactobacillus mulanensis]